METTEKKQTVSGTGIVAHSEEALQEKRLSITALVEKLNADIIVGDIVDDFEENRKETIAKQKDLVQKQQDEQEALYRKEKEEQEAKEAEEERIKQEEKEKTNLLFMVKSLSKKVTANVLKKAPTATEEVEEIQEEELEETKAPALKKNLFKSKGVKKNLKNAVRTEEQEAQKESEEDFEEPLDFEEPFDSIEEIESESETKASAQVEEEHEFEAPKEPKEKKTLKKEQKPTPKAKPARQKAEKRSLFQKKEKPTKKQVSKYKIDATFSDERIVDAYELEEDIPDTPTQKKVAPPEETPEQMVERESQKRLALREEVSRFHDQTDFEEVAKFRNALERLSSDSYYSVSVYAACIIDREFTSLSIIKNVSRLAELIADSDDNLDFYFAYIITNKGVQHYGSDEAISDVSLAMEELRTLFIQKKGRITVEQIQRIPALQIFQTIYYDDNSRGMRRQFKEGLL